MSYATPVTVAAATYALLPELLPEISAAMRAHPELVEGPGQIDTEVMRALPGATSKCGAEGLSCFSLPDGRRTRRQGRRRRRPRPRTGRPRRARGGRRRPTP